MPAPAEYKRSRYHDGQRIHGVRFAWDADPKAGPLVSQLAVRPGSGRTLVVNAAVIGGPVDVHVLTWCDDDGEPLYGAAQCQSCRASSKAYSLRRVSRELAHWALGHRCQDRKVPFDPFMQADH